MSDYLVTDTELTSIADAIRTKGGTSADLSFPTGFVSAINAIPQSGITPSGTLSITQNGTYDVTNYADASVNVACITKLFEQEYTKSYTSTSNTIMDEIQLSVPRSIGRMFYVRVRDKAGVRSGYFYGSDSWLHDANYVGISSSLIATKVIQKGSTRYKGDSAENGIRARGIYTNNGLAQIVIDIKYSSSYSGKINGTFLVQIYMIEFTPPDNDFI